MKPYIIRFSLAAFLVAPLTSYGYLNYQEEAPSIEKAVDSDSRPSARGPANAPLAEGKPLADPRSEEIKSADIRICHGTVIHVGDVQKVRPSKTSGKGVDVITAVNKIVPSNWAVIDDGVKPNQKISWTKNDAWPKALDLVAKVSGACITVDWDRNHVTVSPGTTAASVREAFTRPAEANLAKSQAPSEEIRPAIHESKIDNSVWTLEVGRTLRENLTAWGDRVGWSVVWDVKGTEYMVTHQGTVHGEFLEAIEKVLDAYQAAANPLGAVVYQQNRVIKIVDHVQYNRNTVNQ